MKSRLGLDSSCLNFPVVGNLALSYCTWSYMVFNLDFLTQKMIAENTEVLLTALF